MPPYTYTFASGELVGNIIGFGADNWTDDFRIQSLSFEIISSVPLPSDLALMRHRRKAA